MRLLLDQNLSPRLVESLSSVFSECAHVRALGMASASDEAVWQFARDQGWAIVSKDDDFRQMSVLRGAPPKVIGLLVGNCTTRTIERLLLEHASRIEAFGADQDAAYLPIFTAQA